MALDYNPATDILATSMPDVRPSELPQASYCLGLITDAINNYHVRSLLMDCSKSVMEGEQATCKAIVRQLSTGLVKTRLRKLAWIAATSAELYAELKQELNLTMESKIFSNKAEALDWLLLQEPA